MSNRRRGQRRGSTLIEFTLVGIPMIFVLISTFEMARGMWIYHTLAYAVKEATRYASVHGVSCTTSPNSCGVTIGDIATVLKRSGPALIPNQLTVTFKPSAGSSTTGTLATLMTSTTAWPPASPAGTNAIGQPLTISAVYPFRSAIAMFWPGTKAQGGPGLVYFPASSTDRIQF
jgi:Flp pilus assembly protein TadG